ncbi:hypothetical protein SNE40_020849 [Patella caerulea]|uniref:SOCS box domain-containing protein n=1 Tax=Patella caerulea TaxID=87958 RepID=A0AAN8PGF5_PATCE
MVTAHETWYLVKENCSLKGLDLDRFKDKFEFPDTLRLSKKNFECGAPRREIEGVILGSALHNPELERSEVTTHLDNFRDFCKSRSLKSRCRRDIRNCIGFAIKSKVTQTGLPQSLQHYVIMKDLIPEKYFNLVLNDCD